MNTALSKPDVLRLLLGAASLVIIVAGLQVAQVIIVPFLVASFLAILSLPPFKWLQHQGMSAGFALTLIILIVVALGLVFLFVAGTSISDIQQQLPKYEKSLAAQKEAFFAWLENFGVRPNEAIEKQAIDTKRAVAMFGVLIASLGAMMGNSFVVLLVFAFLLLEASVIESKIEWLARGRGSDESRLDTIQVQVRRYIAIKTALSILTGVLIALWLKILGVDYPVFWGMLAFLFNFIPNIGSILAAVPAVVLALIQFGLGTAISATVGYVIVNGIIGNVVEPRIMGQRLGLSTLVVFASLVFWGWVFGPIGMILSVPLTMIFKIILQSSPKLQWIAIMLGTDAPDAREPSPFEAATP